MTPVCVIAVRRYHASLDTFEEIDEMLLRQAARFDTTFDMATDLGWMMPAFQRMQQQQQQELLKILRILYGLYGGWGLVLNIGFDVTAILHILSLRQLLCQTEALKIGDASGARQSRIFRKTYHTLVVVLITFTFIALGFTAVSFYVAIDINAAMNAAKSIQAVDLTMYYLYAVMGAPVAVLLLVRTIRSRQLSASAASGADGSGSSPPRRSTIFRRGGVTGLGSKHHGRNGGGRIGIDVSTVITVQNGRPGDIPSVRGEHEQFEMVPNARYFAQHAADKQEADSVDRKVQELYFLDLDDDKDVGSTRDGVEKA
ncbi:hypothetical protein Rhopal_000452-T1 [Rhodotorula paludigena]|uniref:Uncharacterized protein n=1 Tax=Rhodotorula paludigena TaxID=86838 RepID=A0AAV5GFT5_9BASI|nr:hypothetical protein Rhopal_000452-T1 [Rhodotorula paludigena]